MTFSMTVHTIFHDLTVSWPRGEGGGRIAPHTCFFYDFSQLDKNNDAKIGEFFVKFYSGDDDMHLKAMSLKLLPWQPEVVRSLFQFMLLDSYLKIKALIR